MLYYAYKEVINLKMLKRLLIFIVLLIIILIITVFVIVKSIAVDTTDSDLPQEIYESPGNLLTAAQLSLLEIPFATDEDQYTIFEEFINYVILDSIRTNINDAYDPLGDIESTDANYVIYQREFFIDYVYATLNEDDQIVVCISFGTDTLMRSRSAIYLYFDVEINVGLLDLSVVLTLDQYHIADKNLSFKILDYLFTKLDKPSIEDSITYGILDLDEYTYTIQILDFT